MAVVNMLDNRDRWAILNAQLEVIQDEITATFVQMGEAIAEASKAVVEFSLV